MKTLFEVFLGQNNYLPLSLWGRFTLNHGKFDKDYEKTIKNIVDNKSGLYIYRKKDRVLYVGKAKLLSDRIRSHFHESYREVSGDTKYKTWHKFFSNKKNIGQIEVLYKEVEGEQERQILEKILDYVLCPEFKEFKKNIERPSR
jgi:excinuclease UvrABC nuclease subunit